MKTIPIKIAQIFTERVNTAKIFVTEQRQYLKWLRYYLDFCEKYNHSPVDPDSANSFMLKLSEKNQTFRQQRLAAKSILVYRDIMKSLDSSEQKEIVGFVSNKKSSSCENKWDAVFIKLQTAIRIRNYSNKTYQTYAGWIGRFEHLE